MTGLSAAYRLCGKGADVTVLEASGDIGGIAGTFDWGGVPLEKYYHHYFKSDSFLIGLIKELGMADSMMWLPAGMGYFAAGRLFNFGTPLSLLKFSPLSFIDKLGFGAAVLKILHSDDYRRFEEITAEEWMIRNAGRRAYETVWQPLLVSKFGERCQDISMAWLWGKIVLRGSSKENGREVLGYIRGSNRLLLDRLAGAVRQRGGRIILGSPVDSIEWNAGFKVYARGSGFSYDRVIDTSPLPVALKTAGSMLPDDYTDEKEKIRYTAVSCMILSLDRPLTKYYWLNIGDQHMPFGGLIEHTNMLPASDYRGRHILYISNYLYKESRYFGMDRSRVLDEYIPHLKRINPSFDRSWIEGVHLFTDEYAQPVIGTGYSRIKPGFRTPVKGFYISDMCGIYPEDRGVNYAIREGWNCADTLMEEAR